MVLMLNAPPLSKITYLEAASTVIDSYFKEKPVYQVVKPGEKYPNISLDFNRGFKQMYGVMYFEKQAMLYESILD